MTDIRHGEVYWYDFGPAHGSLPSARRPCVVVQSDIFNRSLIATTVVCVITSNLARGEAPGNVALRAGDANLPQPSVVNVSQILTVNKADLDERIGKLPAKAIDSIRAGLALLFDRV